MAVVVNNPGTAEGDNGMSLIVGAIILLVMAMLFFMYGIPALRSMTGGTSITVPKQFDVNVNQGGNTGSGGSGGQQGSGQQNP